MQPYTLSVPDMSCGHCRASIEAALAPMNAALSFDMAARELRVADGPPPDAAIAALAAIGFSAQAR